MEEVSPCPDRVRDGLDSSPIPPRSGVGIRFPVRGNMKFSPVEVRHPPAVTSPCQQRSSDSIHFSVHLVSRAGGYPSTCVLTLLSYDFTPSRLLRVAGPHPLLNSIPLYRIQKSIDHSPLRRPVRTGPEGVHSRLLIAMACSRMQIVGVRDARVRR